MIFVLTFALALWFNGAKSWDTFTRDARSFLVDYAVTLAVLVGIAFSYMFNKDSLAAPCSLTDILERVVVPDSLEPTCAVEPACLPWI